jgi:hypothetical protein
VFLAVILRSVLSGKLAKTRPAMGAFLCAFSSQRCFTVLDFLPVGGVLFSHGHKMNFDCLRFGLFWFGFFHTFEQCRHFADGGAVL